MDRHSLGTRVLVNRWLRLSFLAGALAGCSGSHGEALTGEREARTVRALTPELESALAGNDQLAWSVYREARRTGENAFYSPISISAALAMTYTGARAETASEMRDVLGIPEDDEDYHRALGELLSDLTGEHRGRGYSLLLANKLFGQRGYPFNPEFVEFTAAAYAAPFEEVDYVGAPEAARKRVNEWVSVETDGKIPELVGERDIDGRTRLTLANAIYFESTWFSRFDASKTTNATFLLEDGSEKLVPMMQQKGRFRMAEDDTFSALEADYADRELAMLILLPRERGALSAVEHELDTARVAAISSALSEVEIELRLPRFELASELPLGDVLQGLGMPSAFDEARADLSGMLDAASTPNERLYVAKALHAGYLNVDERGTTAAAATAVVVGARSASPTFVVDHPFVVVIRDKLTGACLFVGRIADPS